MSDTVTRAEYDALKAENARLTAELDEARAAFARVSSIDWSAGKQLDMSFKGDGVKLFAAAMCDWFRDGGGENYVSARCTDPRDGVAYEITMRREGGKLPAELADELRADRDALLRAAERLHEAYRNQVLDVFGPDRHHCEDCAGHNGGCAGWPVGSAEAHAPDCPAAPDFITKVRAGA